MCYLKWANDLTTFLKISWMRLNRWFNNAQHLQVEALPTGFYPFKYKQEIDASPEPPLNLKSHTDYFYTKVHWGPVQNITLNPLQSYK